MKRNKFSDDERGIIALRMQEAILSTPVVPDLWIQGTEQSEFYNQLIHIDKIDSGEALLVYASMNSGVGNLLVSGDKNFMHVMHVCFTDIYERLYPRLITFEQCVDAVCQRYSYETIRERLLWATKCDKGLNQALGITEPADWDNFRQGLVSFGNIPVP